MQKTLKMTMTIDEALTVYAEINRLPRSVIKKIGLSGWMNTLEIKIKEKTKNV